jgi:hypothetical protein
MDERFARHLRESRQDGIGVGESVIAATELYTLGETIVDGFAEYPPGTACEFEFGLYDFPNDYDNFDDLTTRDDTEPTWLHVPTEGMYRVSAKGQWSGAADSGVDPGLTRSQVTASNSGTSLDPPSDWGFWSSVTLVGENTEGMLVYRDYAYSGLFHLRPTQWLQLLISAGVADGSGDPSTFNHSGRLGLALLYEL